MKQLIISVFLIVLMSLNLVAQVAELLPAFPQAEGFGAYALGGIKPAVIFVDNLNDDGPEVCVPPSWILSPGS